MPPLAELLPRGVCFHARRSVTRLNSDFVPEDGDMSDEDEDIEVGGVTQDFKCPLTMTVLDNPMTSYAHSLLLLSHPHP